MFRRLSIALALCACCQATRADTLVLANGDSLTGEIVEWNLDSVVLDHPQLGRVRLALEHLDIDTGTPPSPGLFGSNFLRGWNRSIDLGLNGKQGNTENSNLTIGLDFNYADDFKRWSLEGRYFFSRDEDATSDNNGQAHLRRDLLFPESRWFMRTDFRYQYDQFESWRHRITFLAAPGYDLVETEAHTLDAIVGGAFVREFGERKESKFAAAIGVDYKWTMSKRLSLKLSNQLFPEISPNIGEFRTITMGEWKLALTEEPELSLKLGAQNEYETDIEPGDKRNDLTYWLALGLDF